MLQPPPPPSLLTPCTLFPCVTWLTLSRHKELFVAYENRFNTLSSVYLTFIHSGGCNHPLDACPMFTFGFHLLLLLWEFSSPFVCLSTGLHKNYKTETTTLSGRTWCRSERNPLNSGADTGFLTFPLIPQRWWKKEIWHVPGIDIYKRVQSGAAWLNLKGVLGPGGAEPSTQWHAGVFVCVCLIVCRIMQNILHEMWWRGGGGGGHDPSRKNPLHFGADPDQGADPGLVIFHITDDVFRCIGRSVRRLTNMVFFNISIYF